ncbi:MAG TPA: hypothetical protein VGB63_10460 [Pedobacter sp.]|jgi:hypothetical protein
MISLITRQSVFETYKNITSEITEMQKAFFDDDDDYFESQEDKVEYIKLFDAKDIPAKKVKKTYSVISIDHSDINTFTRILSDKLTKLLTKIGISKMIVIAHYNQQFVADLDNKYPPLQKAFKKFEKITGDITYKEAFEITISDLSELIDIAFWIERCHPAGPEFVFFHDIEEKVAFYLCKDGNIHTIQFGGEVLTRDLFDLHGATVVEGKCYDNFSDTGKIEGRKIKV